MSVFEKIGFTIVVFVSIVVAMAVTIGIIVGLVTLLVTLGVPKFGAVIATLALMLFVLVLVAVFLGN